MASIAFAGRRARFGGALLAIVAGSLILMPLIQVGAWRDFTMRASIPALAILALHLADGLGGIWPASRRRRAALLLLLSIGGMTGLTEIIRAISFPAAPPPHCSVQRAFEENFAFLPNGYFAPLDRIPEAIRPDRPARIAPDGQDECFPQGWPRPPLF